MLLDNISQYLLDFTGRIETKGLVSPESAAKIKKYIRREESPARWQLFMILVGMLGAITISAGIFAIISHNWDDLPKTIRGIFSIVPVLVALYFYYRMYMFHRDSKVWIEASSLFLMLMIGASMALVSQTYQMNGDFAKFLKIWLLLTIPLFYLTRASGIAYFYLGLAIALLYSTVQINIFSENPIDKGDGTYWFWLYFLAFLPHFYLTLDRKSNVQGVRVMFLTLITYITLFQALAYVIESNRILWFITYNVGFYLFFLRYMGGHFWFLSRFMSWIPQIAIAVLLVVVTNRYALTEGFEYDSFYKMGDWNGDQWFEFTLLMLVMAGLYYNYFRFKENYSTVNKMILFSPFFIIFLMTVYEITDSWWWLTIPANFYALTLGIVVMVNASEEGRHVKMFGGLILIAALITTRYIDVELSFITKGLLFLCFGGMFFLINLFVKEKVEQIERHKKITDED